MNPDNPERGPIDNEPLIQELELINNELMADAAANRLSDEAVAAKQARKRELEAMLAEQQN